MNYRIDIDKLTIYETGEGVAPNTVFGSLQEAKAGLREHIDHEIGRLKVLKRTVRSIKPKDVQPVPYNVELPGEKPAPAAGRPASPRDEHPEDVPY